MSVDAEPRLQANGLDWRFSLRNDPEHSLAKFPAKAARDQALAVVPKPLKQANGDPEDNPAHVEVVGRKSQGIANSLVAAAQWVRIGRLGRNAHGCKIPPGVVTDI